MTHKRITIFAGHYGSGKTNLAVSYALWLKQFHPHVCVVDLDIVNPYFRTADAKAQLSEQGVRLIASPFANSNVELPAMPTETQSIFDNESLHAVIDLGGDERGALALGRYSRALLAQGDYEMLLVANYYRPLTRTPQELAEIVGEIEGACHVPFTALVNNSNLGRQTTLENILQSASYAKDACEQLHLPLKMTSVMRSVLEQDVLLSQELAQSSEVFPIDIHYRKTWAM